MSFDVDFELEEEEDEDDLVNGGRFFDGLCVGVSDGSMGRGKFLDRLLALLGARLGMEGGRRGGGCGWEIAFGLSERLGIGRGGPNAENPAGVGGPL